LEFHYPKTVKEATALLRKRSSLAVAGGTSFIAPPRVENLVDLTSLRLNYIRDGKKDIVIGATTTATDIMESDLLDEVASTIADTQLRNVITIGGNVACRYNWTCLPPALMVLDAGLRIVGQKDRTMTVQEFYNSRLKPGEFIKEVIVPKKSNAGRGAYMKFTRTSFDYSLVTVAAYAEKDGRKVTLLRVAVDGIANPMRIKSVEDELQGRDVSEDSIAEASSRVAAQLPIAKSYLFDEGYRRELFGTVLRRVLKSALGVV
jgi:CO/xanthine dehydrogenase FAD-binding subunit